MLGKAEFSSDRRYRYTLWRPTGLTTLGYVMFIGLNPSTADENTNDATLRRVVRFARDWGYNRVVMTNLFAFRATDPLVMKRCDAPVGPENDRWLVKTAVKAALIVCAWGAHGTWQGRNVDVEILLRQHDLHCLGRTKHEQPLHPLRLPASLTPLVHRTKF